MATLLSILESGEREHPAIVVPEGPRLTYGELREAVTRTADTLAAVGIERADRVALALPNSAEAVVGFLGVAAAATAAPLNPNYTEEEFRFYMEDTGASALIAPPGQADAARRGMPEGARLLEMRIVGSGVRIDDGRPVTDHRRQMTDAARRTKDEGSASDPSSFVRGAASSGSPASDDVALVLHTSGTTSRPKRVPLTHGNLVASVEHIVATYALGPADVSLCAMPLFHVHGLLASALATLASGGTVVIPSRFNPLGFWPIAAAHGATWYSAVPTIHQLLLARGGAGRPAGAENLRFIRSCSSALAPPVMADLENRFGAPVLEAYGMTEASHQIASNPLPPGDRRPGSVGYGTGVDVAIMDEDGNLLPRGAQGEVVIRGPNVTGGYENNPEANAASFTGGWFRTGDLGMQASDGALSLLGRIKELINRGGEKISPLEIDAVLLRHPAVAEAVAFAAAHPVWGEEVAAAVVTREPVTEAELLRHCRTALAEFKVPRKVHLVEQIPRTPTGKVQRRHVAAAFGEPDQRPART